MKKFCAVLLLVCCLAVFCCCQNNISANRNRQIHSINHRGYADAPENTLAAFRMSKEMGFDTVECDVSFTKDGVPVLLHDKTVDRTSNGHGSIANFTFEEVRSLDFGSWKNKRYAGEKIPTFEEFAQLCKQLDLHAYVEVKNGATPANLQLLSHIALQTELSVSWICYDYDILVQLSQTFEQCRFGLLMQFVTQDAVDKLLLLAQRVTVFADTNYLFLTNAQVELCKINGIPLEVWTMNNRSDIANLNPYISGVTSDNVHAQQLFATL